MPSDVFDQLKVQLKGITGRQSVGRVTSLRRDYVQVAGLDRTAALGDRVQIGDALKGEILRVDEAGCAVMPEGTPEGLRLGLPVAHLGAQGIAPDASWVGRVIDPDGMPLDGAPLFPGSRTYRLMAPPPAAASRRAMGARLRTSMAVFDTLLPIVKGQRIGLFAGSGVGKSRLIATLANAMTADVVVIGLIGERGREVRDFVEDTLGPEGLKRSVVVAATSDQPALTRARCAWTMMAVAEYFRDRGAHVLVLADSITRFAEAQRDVAAAVGEPFGPEGFPASMAQSVMSLVERAGPGGPGQGDITAVLSVLVAGSDMDGPVADVMRGVLDGHVVLSREIAERGRYPAIDVLRSVSRALPMAATEEENVLLLRARELLGAYDRAELMVQAGLYAKGSDPVTDQAIAAWPMLDAFVSITAGPTITDSFDRLDAIVRPGGPTTGDLPLARRTVSAQVTG
ncbi:MAG: FliI/YscN family ATPase [Pseudomonadota bacterium]